MPRTRRPYPRELRLEAVRMLGAGVRSPRQLAEDLGCSAQTLGDWVHEDEADQSERQDLLSEERQRLRELEQPRLDPAHLLRAGDTQPTGTRLLSPDVSVTFGLSAGHRDRLRIRARRSTRPSSGRVRYVGGRR
jgi:transposase-like protein